MAPPRIAVPEPLKKPLAWIGYPLFALVVALTAFYLALPRDRIKDRVEAMAGTALGGKVTIEDFGLTMLGGPGVTGGNVRIEMQKPGEKPAVLKIDDLTVKSGVFAMLRSQIDGSYKAHLAKGHASGTFHVAADEIAVATEAASISLGAFPMLGTWLGIPGVPIDGTLELTVDVTAAKALLAESNGGGRLKITGGVLGDGKAKLTVPGNPYLAAGLTLPKVSLGTIEGSVTIDRGRAVLKGVKSHSSDLDLEVQGYVELRDPLALTVLHLYVLAKPSDGLLKREASLEALVSMGGALAKRPDGYYGIAIGGTPQMPVVLPAKEAPPGLVPAKLPPKSAAAKPGTTAAPPPPAARPSPTTPAPLPRPPVNPEFPEVPPPAPSVPPPPPPPEPSPSSAVPSSAGTAMPSTIAAPPPPPPSAGTAEPTIGQPAGTVTPPPAPRLGVSGAARIINRPITASEANTE